MDQTLRDFGGHNLEYARIILAQARAAGFDCEAWVHSQARFPDEALGCPTRRLFRNGHKDLPPGRAIADLARRTAGDQLYGVARSIKRRLQANPAPSRDDEAMARGLKFATEALPLLDAANLGPEDRVLLPNLHWGEAVCLVEQFAAGPRTGPEILIVMRFDPPESPAAKDRLARAGASRRVVWIADTDQLCTRYATLLGAPVLRAPVPIDGAAIRLAARKRSPPSPVIVACLGESRIEKGFQHLPEIADRVLNGDPDIEMYIQVAARPVEGEDSVGRAVARLKRRRDDRVKLLHNPFSGSEFNELLARAHILLLPYDVAAYRLRSSGLLVQALASGAMVVAPEGESWLSDFIRAEAQVNQATLCAPTPEGYARAILASADKLRAGMQPSPLQLAEERISSPWIGSHPDIGGPDIGAVE